MNDIFIKLNDPHTDELITEFTDEQKEKLIAEFGDHILFISPDKFLDRMEEFAKDNDIALKGNRVKYDDFGINNSARAEYYRKEHSLVMLAGSYTQTKISNYLEFEYSALGRKPGVRCLRSLFIFGPLWKTWIRDKRLFSVM